MHGVSLMTSGKKHHKRRNVGLMYEFIVGHIVDAVGKDDSAAADRAESGPRARPDLDEAPAAVSVCMLRGAHAHRAKTDPSA